MMQARVKLFFGILIAAAILAVVLLRFAFIEEKATDYSRQIEAVGSGFIKALDNKTQNPEKHIGELADTLERGVGALADSVGEVHGGVESASQKLDQAISPSYKLTWHRFAEYVRLQSARAGAKIKDTWIRIKHMF